VFQPFCYSHITVKVRTHASSLSIWSICNPEPAQSNSPLRCLAHGDQFRALQLDASTRKRRASCQPYTVCRASPKHDTATASEPRSRLSSECRLVPDRSARESCVVDSAAASGRTHRLRTSIHARRPARQSMPRTPTSLFTRQRRTPVTTRRRPRWPQPGPRRRRPAPAASRPLPAPPPLPPLRAAP